MGKASLSKEREAPLYNQIDKNRNASENIIEKTVHEQKKENILKAAKEKKKITHKASWIRTTGSFQYKPTHGEQLELGLFKLRKTKTANNLLYPVKVPDIHDGDRKSTLKT